MTAHNERPAGGKTVPVREDPATDAARGITSGVFRFADREHPAVAMLFTLGQSARRRRLDSRRRDHVLEKERRFFAQLADDKPDESARQPGIDPDFMALADLELPSPPQIYTALQSALADKHKTTADIADIVSSDPSLAARLLKLVNSPFYGSGRTIDSILRAVSLVGTEQLSLLASAMSVMTHFKDIPPELIDLPAFWQHALSTGVLARLIAERAGMRDKEYHFLSGLLHDMGRLVLFQAMPDMSRKALLKASTRQMYLHYAEQDEIGYDHSTLGSLLFRKWELPPTLRSTVLYHHIPEISEQVRENAVVHLADIMSRALGYGLSGEYFLPPFSEQAWDSLELQPSDLAAIAENAEAVLPGLFRTIG